MGAGSVEFERLYPHYLHSCSTASVTRLHIFWGRVEGPNIRHLESVSLPDWERDFVQVEGCSPRVDFLLDRQKASRKLPDYVASRKQLVLSFVVESNETALPSGLFTPLIYPGENYQVRYGEEHY